MTLHDGGNVASRLRRYLFGIVATAAAFVLREALSPLTGMGAPFVLFFGATLVTSLFAGVGPGLLVLCISLPLAAWAFAIPAGATVPQAAFQALLYAVDGALVLYLVHLARQAHRREQATNAALRATNESLARSESRTRELIELAPDAFFQADLEGRYVAVNQAACRLVGYAREELIGKTIADLIRPEDRARLADDKAAMQRGTGRTGEWTLRRKDGSEVAVEVSANILPDGRWQAFVRDTSARQLARRELEAAVARLRESEERFRLTLDEAPIGMAIVGLDGRFVRVNRVLCEIVGYGAAELQQRRFQDITYPEDLETDLALAGQLARGEIGRYQLEKRYVRKDGSIVPIMLSGSVLRGPDGQPVHFIAQVEDITERKRAEEALRLSEAKFSGIVSISADAIISVDEQQRITLFNRGAQEIFGYSPQEALGAPLDLLLPEHLRAPHRDHVAGFATGRVTSRRMGERYAAIMGRRKNGEEFPAEASISKLQVGGSTLLTVALRDVTDRKRIEREQALLAEVGVTLGDTLDYDKTLAAVARLSVRGFADWCIVEVVEDRLRRLKVSASDPAKTGIADRLERYPIDRSRPHLMRAAIEQRQPVLVERVGAAELQSFSQGPEHLALLREVAPVSIIALPLLLRGQLLGTLTFLSSTPSRPLGPNDLRLAGAIAERAAAAIENARLYRAATDATRLRDDVLGVVAHDLRNPVSNILLQVNVLNRRAKLLDRSSQRALDAVAEAAARANRLIQDLLDVAVLEAGQMVIDRRELAAQRLITTAADSQRELAAEAGLELVLDVDPDLPPIDGDPHRLLQVFENLIGNAMKFTPAGGRITVGAKRGERVVVFRVSDTGRGISAEQLPHVFDRFWQASARERRLGAGLGLPITQGIVEAHGGTIWVESTPGRGTTFSFSVPVSRATAEPQPGVH